MASTLKKTFSSFRGPSILRRGRERGGGGGGGGGGGSKNENDRSASSITETLNYIPPSKNTIVLQKFSDTSNILYFLCQENSNK